MIYLSTRDISSTIKMNLLEGLYQRLGFSREILRPCVAALARAAAQPWPPLRRFLPSPPLSSSLAAARGLAGSPCNPWEGGGGAVSPSFAAPAWFWPGMTRGETAPLHRREASGARGARQRLGTAPPSPSPPLLLAAAGGGVATGSFDSDRRPWSG